MNRKMVVFDLDRTIWDHEDISATTPPYRALDASRIADSGGTIVTLRSGVRELLGWLLERGALLAVVSWNVEWIAVEALKSFGIHSYFSFLIIEFHPRKDRMFEKLFRASGLGPKNAIYIDDDEGMVRLVKKRYPEIHTILYLRDARSMGELRRLLESLL